MYELKTFENAPLIALTIDGSTFVSINYPIEPPDPPLLPEHPGAIAARLSIDEVVQLALLLGLTPPPSVANAVLAAGAGNGSGLSPGAEADLVAGVVRRGLFARGVLDIDEDERLRMDDDAVAIMTTICRPAMVVTVTTGRGTAVTTTQRRTIYALPGGAVVETARDIGGEGVMDYMSMPVESIMPSVVQWTGLDSRPAPSPESGAAPFTVIAGEAARAGEAIAAGDVEAAVKLLTGQPTGGFPAGPVAGGSAAEAYLRALAAAPAGANSVTILHRAEDQLTVSLTAWNDCGSAGLWLVEQDDALALYGQDTAGIAGQPAELDTLVMEAPITFTPISGDGVLGHLMTGMPT